MYDKKVLSKFPFNSSQKKYKIVGPCRDLMRVNYRKWNSTIKLQNKCMPRIKLCYITLIIAYGIYNNNWCNVSVVIPINALSKLYF